MSAWLQTMPTRVPYRPDLRRRAESPEVDESPRSRTPGACWGKLQLPLAPNATRAQRNDGLPALLRPEADADLGACARVKAWLGQWDRKPQLRWSVLPRAGRTGLRKGKGLASRLLTLSIRMPIGLRGEGNVASMKGASIGMRTFESAVLTHYFLRRRHCYLPTPSLSHNGLVSNHLIRSEMASGRALGRGPKIHS